MTLHHRLLDDRLIRYRDIEGEAHEATLPELLAAFTRDVVRDFPALRPHQRHPWHAFLVQLAAIATHTCDPAQRIETAEDWRRALLALTPDDADGAAFALVSPDDRPALLQAPCAGGESRGWKRRLATPDALDMLVTSKNHDVKAARMMLASPEDWLYALVSLQTQEGYLGAGNFGISRMNGGFASRPAFGVVPAGNWGRRWQRDTQRLLAARDQIVRDHALKAKGGVALVWLRPWDGTSSLSFTELDPFYIEICRRVRLDVHEGRLVALGTSSKVARIVAKERSGMTGDAWTPINIADGRALSITARGFDYRLLSALAFDSAFEPTIARSVREDDGKEGLALLAQAVTRGKGKTEGYHERRIPVSPAMRRAFLNKNTDALAKVSKDRIQAIADVRKMLWGALCGLFSNGDAKSATDDIKKKADEFAKPFEEEENRRFFDDLIAEIDSKPPDHADTIHDRWLCDLVDRAERVLMCAFIAGPRATVRRYQAQSAALSRFHVGLRRSKHAPPRIARVLAERDELRKKNARADLVEEISEAPLT